MSETLEPEVLGCYFDEGFSPPLAAMRLRWVSLPFQSDRLWDLPGGVRVAGPAPRQFGITIRRLAVNAFHVSLLWDEMRYCWPALSRSALEASSVGLFLSAIGTELHYLLEQPIEPEWTRIFRMTAA